jgi:release factor glutamine methyltransferase
MRTVTQHLNWGKEFLSEHGIIDANLSTKILLSFVTGIPKIEFITHPHAEISTTMTEWFKDLVQRRASGEPIAYLIGEKEFYGLTFKVSEHVLIPRPETEILIEWFGQRFGDQRLAVCDVGTGSGAIAVALKKNFPCLDVTAVDVSSQALEMARENIKSHEVNIQTLESNLLEQVTGPFDVIVANLPYVPEDDIANLSQEVQNEPKLALASGKDGLDHYRNLIPQLKGKLKQGGSVFFEYGIGQTQRLISLLQEHSFTKIEVRKDFAGIDRIIHGTR